MTLIIDKELRDEIGIDCFERAILWSSCLLLSAKMTQSSQYNRDFLIFADQTTKNILIDFFMPLDMPLFWASMGNSDLSLKNISEELINYQGRKLTRRTILEREPISVNTLEKYLIWCCNKLAKNYGTNNLSIETSNIIKLSTDIKKSALILNCQLAYNPIIYNNKDNLLEAVLCPSIANSLNRSLIGNSLFGNSFAVKN